MQTYDYRFIASLLAATLAAPLDADVIHVDDDAAPGGDGSSWKAAFATLHEALDAAAGDPSIDEIRLGAGTYWPDEANGSAATFELVGGVDLVGGYAGLEGVDPDERDIAAWPTILTGLLPGGVRCSRVVTADALATKVRLDGLTARDGNRGLFVADSEVFVVDTVFDDHEEGSAVRCEVAAQATFLRCSFVGNTSDWKGGALWAVDSHIELTSCAFVGNWSWFDGGAVALESCTGSIAACGFIDNFAGNALLDSGGGVYLSASSPPIDRCFFEGNWGHGALACFDGSNPEVTACTIRSNSGDFGGGMRNHASSPAVSGCDFEFNGAEFGGGMFNGGGSNPVVSGCRFTSSYISYGEGGGMHNRDGSSPLVVDCIFEDTNLAWWGGGMSNVDSSPTIVASTFRNNVNDLMGAGIIDSGSTTTIIGCRFEDNVSEVGGTAIQSTGGMTVVSSVFTGNVANDDSGSGQDGYAVQGVDALINCTIVGNSAAQGAAVRLGDGAVTSCVIRGNLPAQISGDAGGDVTYSNVEGGYAGAGNIDADAHFVDAPNGDLRLAPGSPCIDAGDTLAVPAGHDRDVLGGPRFVDDPDTPDTGNPDGIHAMVDMGAYEYTPWCAGDIDGDGAVDVDDLIVVLSAWGTPGGDLDGDGTTDVTDLLIVMANWGACP